eukprot:357133_1
MVAMIQSPRRACIALIGFVAFLDPASSLSFQHTPSKRAAVTSTAISSGGETKQPKNQLSRRSWLSIAGSAAATITATSSTLLLLSPPEPANAFPNASPEAKLYADR